MSNFHRFNNYLINLDAVRYIKTDSRMATEEDRIPTEGLLFVLPDKEIFIPDIDFRYLHENGILPERTYINAPR